MAISPDMDTLAAAGNPTIRLFDLETKATDPLSSFEGHTRCVLRYVALIFKSLKSLIVLFVYPLIFSIPLFHKSKDDETLNEILLATC